MVSSNNNNSASESILASFNPFAAHPFTSPQSSPWSSPSSSSFSSYPFASPSLTADTIPTLQSAYPAFYPAQASSYNGHMARALNAPPRSTASLSPSSSSTSASSPMTPSLSGHGTPSTHVFTDFRAELERRRGEADVPVLRRR